MTPGAFIGRSGEVKAAGAARMVLNSKQLILLFIVVDN
jgi:hypothetical protein